MWLWFCVILRRSRVQFFRQTYFCSFFRFSRCMIMTCWHTMPHVVVYTCCSQIEVYLSCRPFSTHPICSSFQVFTPFFVLVLPSIFVAILDSHELQWLLQPSLCIDYCTAHQSQYARKVCKRCTSDVKGCTRGVQESCARWGVQQWECKSGDVSEGCKRGADACRRRCRWS